MSKGNMIYDVVVYEGGLASQDTRVIYTCSKESDAEKYLVKYLDEHPEICKAYIERSFNRRLNRNKLEPVEEN